MDDEVKKAIEILERYIQSKENEIIGLKGLIQKAKDDNPIIERGYFKIISYVGGSTKIVPGRIYRGRTFLNKYRNRRQGFIPNIHAYFTEDNASWILSSKEEFDKQAKL